LLVRLVSHRQGLAHHNTILRASWLRRVVQNRLTGLVLNRKILLLDPCGGSRLVLLHIEDKLFVPIHCSLSIVTSRHWFVHPKELTVDGHQSQISWIVEASDWQQCKRIVARKVYKVNCTDPEDNVSEKVPHICHNLVYCILLQLICGWVAAFVYVPAVGNWEINKHNLAETLVNALKIWKSNPDDWKNKREADKHRHKVTFWTASVTLPFS
jgi:hypothetical protein